MKQQAQGEVYAAKRHGYRCTLCVGIKRIGYGEWAGEVVGQAGID